jgi:hypothetical protein
MSLNDPQPTPIKSDRQPIWDLVIDDMQDRDEKGTWKYGIRLRSGDGRDSLIDAYQESLDLAVYLRKAIFERDGK